MLSCVSPEHEDAPRLAPKYKNTSRIINENSEPGVADSYVLAKYWVNSQKVLGNKVADKIRTTSHNQAKTKLLTIDFSELLNYPSRLTISPWNTGITWKLEVEDTKQKFYFFGDAAVPLSFITTQDKCNEWYLSIPEEIRITIQSYPQNEFAILYLTSHYTQAYQLFVSHPILFSMMLLVAKEQKLEEDKLVEMLSRSRTEIMQYCGFPATKSAVRLLGKVYFETFNMTIPTLINELFKVEGYASLNHREHIDLRTIKILYKFPELVKTLFIRHFNYKSKIGFSYLSLIQDTVRLGDRLGVNSIERVGKCRSYEELNFLHDKLADENSLQKNKVMLEVVYDEPPIQGSENIIPITTWIELFNEGMEQCHCVEVYHEKIMEGYYYVYQVLSPERATLGVKLQRGCKPKIDQLFLARNRHVSNETQLIVRSWLNNHRQKE